MIHIVQYKNGRTQEYVGPPIIRVESHQVGLSRNRSAPGDWVKVTVEALGHGSARPGAKSQGPDSAINTAAGKPWDGDIDTTEMYTVVELDGQPEPLVHRGPPGWDSTSLKIDDDVYREGKWTKVTIHPKGWSATQTVESDEGDST